MAIVTGALSRKTGELVPPVIPDTGKEFLPAFVDEVMQAGVTGCTGEHEAMWVSIG